MTVEDGEGSLSADQRVEAVATFRDQRTGEVLNAPLTWHFGTKGNGEPAMDFMTMWREVR